MRKPLHPIKSNPDWGKGGVLSFEERQQKRQYDREYKQWRKWKSTQKR